MQKQKQLRNKILTIRFDAPTYKQLKKLAKEEGRSLGGQARFFVERGLMDRDVR